MQQPTPNPRPRNRRAGDRGQSTTGVAAGGRRDSDRPGILPRSNVAKLAIASSFLFSAGVMAWAFTIPFRSNSRVDRAALETGVQQARLEYEASLSSDEYIDYTRNLDRRLLDQAKKRSARVSVPDHRDATTAWEKRVATKQRLIKEMFEEAGEQQSGEQRFAKGSVQWQYQQEVEAAGDDAPRGL